MIVKSQHHKQFLLEMMQQVNFPGKFLDLAYEVKQELLQAEVLSEPKTEPMKVDQPKD